MVTPSAKVQYAGVNIAGFEFGSTGNCGDSSQTGADGPLASEGHADGIGQMNHFVTDDGLNAFRLPVSYQYLVNGNVNANVPDTNNFNEYDKLVQGCLGSGAALCIIDLHKYMSMSTFSMQIQLLTNRPVWYSNVIGRSSGAPSGKQNRHWQEKLLR